MKNFYQFHDLYDIEKKLAFFANSGGLFDLTGPTKLSFNDKYFHVRADFLSFLILGGNNNFPVHNKGPQLKNINIIGNIDLKSCINILPFKLEKCIVDGEINLEFAQTRSIILDGTTVNGGIKGNRANINGSLYLRHGFHSKKIVDLSGSHISGSLACRGGAFDDDKDDVNYFALRIEHAKIDGAIQIGPRSLKDVCNTKEMNITKLRGSVSFKGTVCGVLIDHPDTYKDLGKNNYINLDGFVYSRLEGVNNADLDFRIKDWLKKQIPENIGENFLPQPYEKLASALLKMGHEDEANLVGMETKNQLSQKAIKQLFFIRNRKLSIENLKNIFKTINNIPLIVLRSLSYLLLLGIGFGYKPSRALIISLLPIIAGYIIFYNAYESGAIVPTNIEIAKSTEWSNCVNLVRESKTLDGSLDKCIEGVKTNNGLKEYPKFDPIWFSIDTYLPIVNLRQKDFWQPNARWSSLADIYLKIHIITGWFMVTLGIAGILGLVNRGNVN
jgi:hypothetical protein